MGTVATVVLDDVDVTAYCTAGSVTLRLNRISSASVTINMLPLSEIFGTMYPAAGSYLKVYFQTDLDTTPVLYHHGRVLSCETAAAEDTGYTVFNSSDPLELWQHRPVRDDDGDFSKPNLINTYQFATQIIEAMFNNSEDTTAGGGGPPPTFAEGPLRLDLSTVEAGVKQITADPTDWPMTMAELTALLVSTNTVDVVVEPIEFDANENYGRLTLWNGDFGFDLTSTVVFQYGMGLRNVRSLRWNEDMTNMCNKLWYYLGPRVLTSSDPAGDQHWKANIQGDDPAFAPPDRTGTDGVTNGTDQFVSASAPFLSTDVFDKQINIVGVGRFRIIAFTSSTTVTLSDTVAAAAGQTWFIEGFMSPPGGRLSPPASSVDNQIGVQDYLSRIQYDVRMDIKIFDGDREILGRDLYRRTWQEEQWLRSQPRTLVHVTPDRDTGIGEFTIGDIVLVEASTDVKGGFSGAQRIYEYTISWDAEESVPAISELQVSSDQSGFDT